MTRILVFVAILSAASLVSTGCFNAPSFQGAEVLKPGDTRRGVGATVTRYQLNEDQSIPAPAITAWYRRGLIDKLEAHARIWLPLGAIIGLKYQLIGGPDEGGLSVATGVDFSYFTLSTGEGNDSYSDTFVDTYVPLYLGYRLSDGFAAYAVPKYLLRHSAPSDEASSFEHAFGGALGFGLGAKSTVHLEAAFLYSKNEEGPIVTGAIGYAF